MATIRHIILKICLYVIALFALTVAAASAATFQLEPRNSTVSTACESEVQVLIDTEGKESNAADIEIRFDPAKITIIDSNPNISGTQIKTYSAYEAYFGNQVDSENGVIRLTAASFSSTLKGKSIFASIRFQPKQGASDATFDIYYNAGSSTDSNIAESPTSNDILTGVVNSKLTITNAKCTESQSPIQIKFINPYSSSQILKNKENITLHISDELDYINLDTVKIKLNNEYYYPQDEDVNYTGDKTAYEITFKPRIALPEETYSTLYVEGQDLKGNKEASSLIFNIPAGATQEEPEMVCQETVDSSNKSSDCRIDKQIANTISNIPIVKSVTSSPVIQRINENIPTSVKSISQEMTTAGFLAGVISTGIIANILSILLLLRSPQVLFSILGLLKKDRPWGVVYDEKTHKAVPFAVLRLFLKGSKAMIAQTVTDSEGKYGFIIDPGEYRLEVEHPEYQKTKLEISVDKASSSIIQDISLSSEKTYSFANSYRKLLQGVNKIFTAITPGITIIGLLLSSIAIVLKPSTVNIVFFFIYLLLALLYVYKRLRRPKFWGIVYDADSNLLVPNVLVKIFDRKDWQMVNTHITDNKGRFPLQENPGEYAILLSSRDYNFPSGKQKDLKVIEEKLGGLLAFSIKEGKSPELELYLDPKDTNNTEVKENGNYPSPF